MGFLGDLFGKKDKDYNEPTLSVESVGGLSEKTEGSQTTNDLMLLTELLQIEKLLSASEGAFQNEKERQNSLPPPVNRQEVLERNNQLGALRTPIDNYQNQIRDKLRSNGVSPTNKPNIYAFYVEGRNVADENYSSERVQNLETLLNDKNAFSGELNLPTASEMEQISNRRQATDEDFNNPTPSSSEQIEPPQTEQDLTDEEKRLANLRANRNNEPLPFPNLNQDETDEGNENLERREQRQDPNLYGDYDNQGLKDYEDDLKNQLQNDPNNQAIRDELNDINQEQERRGNDLRNDLQNQRSQDLEQTNNHHDETNDNTAQGLPLPFKLLEGVQYGNRDDEDDVIDELDTDFQEVKGSRTNYDTEFINLVLRNVFSFTSKFIIGLKASGRNVLGEERFGLGFRPEKILQKILVGKAISEGVEQIASGVFDRGEPNRFTINSKETHLLNHNEVLPFLCIAIYFYMIKNQNSIKINVGFFMRKAVSAFCKDVLNLNDAQIDFIIFMIKTIPNDLGTAFLKNINQKTPLTASEDSKIKFFITNMEKEYEKIFLSSLKEDLFLFENKQSYYLYEMINGLNDEEILYNISATMDTLSLLISQLEENPYLLIQLLALLYEVGEQFPHEFFSEDILSRGQVEKYVYYKSKTKFNLPTNDKIQILQNISLPISKRKLNKNMNILEETNEVGLYKYNNKYYVAFRGTDKNEKDLLLNIINMSGKNWYNDPIHNERIKLGNKYIKIALQKSREENLENPIILGYSLGSLSALFLSMKYDNLETNLYSPILSKSSLTERILGKVNENSLVNLNYVENDPISNVVNQYIGNYPNINFRKRKYNRFYNPHSLNQYI